MTSDTLLLERFADLKRRRRLETLAFTGLFVIVLVVSAIWTEFYPSTVLAGLPKIGEYVQRLVTIEPEIGQSLPVLSFHALFADAKTPQSIAYWFYRIDVYLALLWQTIQMAILATVMGFTLAFVLAFPASRNLVSHGATVFLVRRFLELLRSVPEIVFALLFVWCFGIGPLAGILAIGIHTAGALGKLFSEFVENSDPRPLEGMRAAGANWVEMIRYGVVPQVMPGFLSYALLRFEINIRASTVIGFVGAGGIGQEFRRVIGLNIYEEVSAIVILVVISVMAVDLLSERIRHRFIGAPS